MRLFLYEFVTGGGWFEIDTHVAPQGSLAREGSAMLLAIASDFTAIPDCRVSTQRDIRLPPLELADIATTTVSSLEEDRRCFAQHVAQADGVLIIAPEFAGHLQRRAALVESAGRRLLSPGSEFIFAAADKWRSHLHFTAGLVPSPVTRLISKGDALPDDLRYPLVLKPRDGCGSMGVQLITREDETVDGNSFTGPDALVQEFHRGRSVSMAVLCGQGQHVLLPLAEQHLSADGRFTYCGGSVPLSAGLHSRAARLVEKALVSLPATQGFIGFDLVLGESVADDVVIEVNPRLTTSYVGLRALSQVNLAAAMLEMIERGTCRLAWRQEQISFTSSGEIAIQKR